LFSFSSPSFGNFFALVFLAMLLLLSLFEEAAGEAE
jgi:hypothetical protein